jgi:hypothetical protein
MSNAEAYLLAAALFAVIVLSGAIWSNRQRSRRLATEYKRLMKLEEDGIIEVVQYGR